MFGQDLEPDMGPAWRRSLSNGCWSFTQAENTPARQHSQGSLARQSGEDSQPSPKIPPLQQSPREQPSLASPQLKSPDTTRLDYIYKHFLI